MFVIETLETNLIPVTGFPFSLRTISSLFSPSFAVDGVREGVASIDRVCAKESAKAENEIRTVMMSLMIVILLNLECIYVINSLASAVVQPVG